MSKTLKGSSLAGGSKQKRVDNDYYATDPKSIELFLNNHLIQGESFYEPCCGKGHISKVLEERFPLARHYASDLIVRGFGTGGVDFLSDDFDINTIPFYSGHKQPKDKVDWIITNPPFSLGREFIDKSLSVTNKGVVMFLKAQFKESKARKQWLKDSPLKYIYTFSDRQVTFRNGVEKNPKTGKKWANTIMFEMFVWEHEYTGEPVQRWL